MLVSPISNNSSISQINGTTVKTPTRCEYQIYDVSATDAGESDDGTMYKYKQGEKYTLSVSWENISVTDAVVILGVCKNEYENVTFLDPATGTFVTREFYFGNRTIGNYNGVTGKWDNISFNMIQRSVSQ